MIKTKTIKHRVVHHAYTDYEEENVPILKASQYGPWKKSKFFEKDNPEWVRRNLCAKKGNYNLNINVEGPCVDRGDPVYWEVEMYYYEELSGEMNYFINTVYIKEFKTKEGALKCVDRLLIKYKKDIPGWKR